MAPQSIAAAVVTLLVTESHRLVAWSNAVLRPEASYNTWSVLARDSGADQSCRHTYQPDYSCVSSRSERVGHCSASSRDMRYLLSNKRPRHLSFSRPKEQTDR